MATLDELLAQADTQLGGQITAPEQTPIPTTQVIASSPTTEALKTATGGLINIGSGLTLGLMPKIVAGGSALVDVITGEPTLSDIGNVYQQRLAQVKGLESQYKQVAPSAFGVPLTEIGGSLLMPIPKGITTTAPTTSTALKVALPVAKQSALGGTTSAAESYIKSEKPLLSKERLVDALNAYVSGGTTGALFGAAGEAIKTAAPAAVETGKALLRSSLGPRISDYTSKAQRASLSRDDNPVTMMEKALDWFNEKNVLGKSRDEKTLAKRFFEEERKINDKIDNAVAEAEQKVGPVPVPEMKNTQALLDAGEGITAPDIDKYRAELARIKDSIEKEGWGSLSYLQQQKKNYGAMWKPFEGADNAFNRAVYSDLKQHIEKYVPGIKDLNKEAQNFVVAKPVIQREAAKEGGKLDLSKLKYAFATTGGYGVPLLLGASNPAALLGAGLAAGLSTKQGQRIIGDILAKAPSLAANTDELIARGVLASQAGDSTKSASVEPFAKDVETKAQLSNIESLFNELRPAQTDSVNITRDVIKPQLFGAEKQDTSALINNQPPLIKAIIQTESAGKPQVKSKKGATGLMQLMPATARDLGVDPTDPAQNIEGGTRYINQMLDKFGDEKLALAAYNWGPANLQRAIVKTERAGLDPTWENILETTYVPAETRKYVGKVITKRNQLEA